MRLTSRKTLAFGIVQAVAALNVAASFYFWLLLYSFRIESGFGACIPRGAFVAAGLLSMTVLMVVGLWSRSTRATFLALLLGSSLFCVLLWGRVAQRVVPLHCEVLCERGDLGACHTLAEWKKPPEAVHLDMRACTGGHLAGCLGALRRDPAKRGLVCSLYDEARSRQDVPESERSAFLTLAAECAKPATPR